MQYIFGKLFPRPFEWYNFQPDWTNFDFSEISHAHPFASENRDFWKFAVALIFIEPISILDMSENWPKAMPMPNFKILGKVTVGLRGGQKLQFPGFREFCTLQNQIFCRLSYMPLLYIFGKLLTTAIDWYMFHSDLKNFGIWPFWTLGLNPFLRKVSTLNGYFS